MSTLIANNLINSLSEMDGNVEIKKENYIKPILKELSEEEIQMIHEQGLLTPAEWVAEMEEKYPEVCIFTNGCERCYTFANCHDCLVDYANHEEKLESLGNLFASPISKSEVRNLIHDLSPEQKDKIPVKVYKK